jgi:hypothetical protein
MRWFLPAVLPALAGPPVVRGDKRWSLVRRDTLKEPSRLTNQACGHALLANRHQSRPQELEGRRRRSGRARHTSRLQREPVRLPRRLRKQAKRWRERRKKWRISFCCTPLRRNTASVLGRRRRNIGSPASAFPFTHHETRQLMKSFKF